MFQGVPFYIKAFFPLSYLIPFQNDKVQLAEGPEVTPMTSISYTA